jgi:hypothetical protein
MKNKLLTLPFIFLTLLACSLTSVGEQAQIPTGEIGIESFPTASYIPLYVSATEVLTDTAPSTQPFCVSNNQTVYLRRTPNTKEYPLGVLANGEKVYPNGRVDGSWLEVSTELGTGWVNGNYIRTCTSPGVIGLYDRSEWYYDK